MMVDAIAMVRPLDFLKWLIFAPIIWLLMKLGLWDDDE